MADWLIFIVSCFLSGLLTILFLWAGDIAFNKPLKDACERATERERMRLLIDNSEIDETIAKIDKMEMKVEPIETVQPVSEPSPADLVIQTVKENKW